MWEPQYKIHHEAAKAKLEAYHGITILDMIMEEAIAAYEAGKWRPISEAPRDGEGVIIYQPYFADDNTVRWHRKPREEYTCTAFFDESRNAWFEFQAGDGYEYQESIVYPTHYQPLPTPPNPTNQSGGFDMTDKAIEAAESAFNEYFLKSEPLNELKYHALRLAIKAYEATKGDGCSHQNKEEVFFSKTWQFGKVCMDCGQAFKEESIAPPTKAEKDQ